MYLLNFCYKLQSLGFKITKPISVFKEEYFCCLKWLWGENILVIKYILLDGIIILGKDWRTNPLASNCQLYNWKEYKQVAGSVLSMSALFFASLQKPLFQSLPKPSARNSSTLSYYYPSEMGILLMIRLVDEPETKSRLWSEKQQKTLSIASGLVVNL